MFNNMRIFFDNAATTPLDNRVIERMTEIMQNNFGNPSSIHSEGRKSRTIIENARKNIASMLSVAPGEIFFTSGGTEADNMILNRAVHDQEIKHIITSQIEHHAVLHTVQHLEKQEGIKVSYVKIKEDGHIDLEHLEEIMRTNASGRMLVSLMHANNETGNLTDLSEVGRLCAENDALFHSDTVQTIGHIPVNPKEWGIHFMAASAHKFHGPKGTGFAYIDNEVRIRPFIYGGAQERNMRGGTENIYGIAGTEKALELAVNNMEEERQKITGIKKHFIEQLKSEYPDAQFNGDAEGQSHYTILNVHFPGSDLGEMFLFNLDINGISASGGSACSSGSNAGSHVLQAIYGDARNEGASVRFSFGRFNTIEEVDKTIEEINKACKV